MYSLYGVSYDISDPENIAAAKKEALDSLRKSLVLTAKAKEFGFDILSDEEQAAVQGKARESYESAMEYVKQYMLEDTESMDADLVTQKAVEKLNEMEITLDSYIKTETEQVINEKLRAYIVRDVSVSAEEIKTEQDKRTEAENEAWDLSEDGIRESLLADKQDELYNAMVDYWIKNAGVEEHLDELDD